MRHNAGHSTVSNHYSSYILLNHLKYYVIFVAMVVWLIHVSKLAYDFKMAHPGFKTCLRFQDNWDND